MLAFSVREALRQAAMAFGPAGTAVHLASPATPEAVWWALSSARSAAGSAAGSTAGPAAGDGVAARAALAGVDLGTEPGPEPGSRDPEAPLMRPETERDARALSRT
jgi:xanthine dehydrogenase large subunit